MNQFAQVLSKFDEVTLLDIYPAREEPIKGVNSNKLLNQINNINKNLVDKLELKKVVKDSKADVFIIMGAGDISDEVYKIKDVILN